MHDHSHHDHHSHSHAPHGSSFLIGIALNAAFVAAEAAYGLSAGSLALLADAGHNASDVLSLALTWGAIYLAKKQPSARFTYGLQSASIMAALANALLLLVAVGAIAWQAIHRFGNPELPATGVMMAVAAAGIAVNGFTAWLFRTHHHDLNVRGAFLHMMADAAISLGVVMAGALIVVTGWLWLDPAIGLVIALIIVVSTWHLLRDSLSLALHAVPKNIDVEKVRTFLASLPGVTEVHDLHVWAMSTTGVAMSTHLRMPGGHPGDAFIHHVACEMEEHFHIHHSTIQIETGTESCECPFGQTP